MPPTTVTTSTETTAAQLHELTQKLKSWGFRAPAALDRNIKHALVADLRDGLIAIARVSAAGVELTLASEWADGTRRAALVLAFDTVDELADALREVRASAR